MSEVINLGPYRPDLYRSVIRHDVIHNKGIHPKTFKSAFRRLCREHKETPLDHAKKALMLDLASLIQYPIEKFCRTVNVTVKSKRMEALGDTPPFHKKDDLTFTINVPFWIVSKEEVLRFVDGCLCYYLHEVNLSTVWLFREVIIHE